MNPQARDLSEDRRFPFCTREGLTRLAREAGLDSKVTVIEAHSVFRDFDDFWRPFTLGAGPAPGYRASLCAEARERLRMQLSDGLPRQRDGSISLGTRAWAFKARIS